MALLPLARLVALIDQTTDRNAVQASPSSGRRISTPILPAPERPGSCFSRRGLGFLSDSVGCLIRAHAQAAALAGTELQPRARLTSSIAMPFPANPEV